VLYRPSNYNPPALLLSMLITIARRASWMSRFHNREDVEQLARVFWIYLLDVYSMFARSCRPVARMWKTRRHQQCRGSGEALQKLKKLSKFT